MRSRTPLAPLLLALAACSSAGAPGGKDVLRQVDRAKMTQVEAALSTAARGEEAHMSTQGSYTTDVRALNASPPPDVALAVVRADATQFCIEATHAGLDGTWHVTNSSATAEGSC
jgi:Tfp pilus assembly protein PilE